MANRAMAYSAHDVYLQMFSDYGGACTPKDAWNENSARLFGPYIERVGLPNVERRVQMSSRQWTDRIPSKRGGKGRTVEEQKKAEFDAAFSPSHIRRKSGFYRRYGVEEQYFEVFDETKNEWRKPTVEDANLPKGTLRGWKIRVTDAGRKHLETFQGVSASGAPASEHDASVSVESAQIHAILKRLGFTAHDAAYGEAEVQLQRILDDLKPEGASKKQIVLHGPPGVGKSQLMIWLAEALANGVPSTLALAFPDGARVTRGGRRLRSGVALVQFHESYAYDHFVEGYFPAGRTPPLLAAAAGGAGGGGETPAAADEDDSDWSDSEDDPEERKWREDEAARLDRDDVKFTYKVGPFLDLYRRARNHLARWARRGGDGSDGNEPYRKKTYVLADEFNRANLANVMGELFVSLERKPGYAPRTLYSGLPLDMSEAPNLLIIACLNDADKALGDSVALRRRFHYVECPAPAEEAGEKADVESKLEAEMQKYGFPTLADGLLRRVWRGKAGEHHAAAIETAVKAVNNKLRDDGIHGKSLALDLAVGPSYFLTEVFGRQRDPEGGPKVRMMTKTEALLETERVWRTAVYPYVVSTFGGDRKKATDVTKEFFVRLKLSDDADDGESKGPVVEMDSKDYDGSGRGGAGGSEGGDGGGDGDVTGGGDGGAAAAPTAQKRKRDSREAAASTAAKPAKRSAPEGDGGLARESGERVSAGSKRGRDDGGSS